MARQPRFDLPGIPQHVVQRGNSRLPCFLDDLDRQRYLQCLRQALGRFGCRPHAYVLMSNHVHLLHPVRAWMVARPGDYPWSSYGAHAGEREDPLLVAHPAYLALGTDPASRAAAYWALFDDALPDELVAEIRGYLQQQKVLGTDRFRAWVEERTGRFAAARPLGRPPRRAHCP
jgi:putative transposase